MNRKYGPSELVLWPAFTCFLATAAAWGGCGTIVRNPGDDAEIPPGDSRNEGGTPPPPSQGKDPESPPSGVQFPECQAVIRKSPGVVGRVEVTFVAKRGEPPLDVTNEYVFTIKEEADALQSSSKVILTAARNVQYAVTKSGAPFCGATFEVSDIDIASGGAWEVGITVK